MMWRYRIQVTLTLSLLLVMASGALIAGASLPGREKDIMRAHFWLMKTHGVKNVDMILLGDSRTYRGLSPQEMQTVLADYRILNFGYSAGGLNPTIYHEGEAKLDPRSEKRTVVLGITPSTLMPVSAPNLDFLQWKFNDPLEVSLALKLFPLYRFLYPIDPSEFISPVAASSLHEEYHDDGWVASWSDAAFLEKRGAVKDAVAFPTFAATLGGSRVVPAPGSPGSLRQGDGVSAALVEALMRQTNQWVEQGIRVFGFRLPTDPGVRERENASSGFDEGAFVKAFEAAGGVWIDVPLQPYHTTDGSHLDRDSALLLSRDLAERIRAWLATYSLP
jgi:hypothetical protein